MSPTITRQRVGLALAGLLSVLSIPSVLVDTGSSDAPPTAILVLGSILGVIGVIAVIVAWPSGNRAAIRVVAGALILNLLTSLPAFFVDVPPAVKLLTGLGVLVTVVAVGLMFSTVRRPVPALD
jgi:hypothetical protein